MRTSTIQIGAILLLAYSCTARELPIGRQLLQAQTCEEAKTQCSNDCGGHVDNFVCDEVSITATLIYPELIYV